MSRLKPHSTISSRTEFDATIDDICRIQLDLETLTAARDHQLADVRELHGPVLDALSESLAAKLTLCEKYATVHRETLFGKLKTAASHLGLYGFRIGNPKLCLLNRKWKWADVLESLKANDRTELIRVKEECDKDALKKLEAAEQAAFGLRIEQDEDFFIEPKRDNPERLNA